MKRNLKKCYFPQREILMHGNHLIVKENIEIYQTIPTIEKLLNTTPSDLSGTATAEAKLRYVYSILKPHGQSFRRQVRLLLSKAKLNYVYSIVKLHCQICRSPIRQPLGEAKQSYVYRILNKHHLSRVSPKQLCASAQLGSTRAAGSS